MTHGADLVALEAASDRFFQRHWNAETIGSEPPTWIGWPEFKGSVPNYQLAGCYALFEGPTIRYVGVGASKGGGLYPEHGISRRLMSHVLRSDRERGREWSRPRPGWESINTIYTIGFPVPVAHLSLALESFLIREFAGKLKNSRV
jgi:hypothetical protein